jgi:ribosomal protein S18 acetylase RimI-like enzyme
LLASQMAKPYWLAWHRDQGFGSYDRLMSTVILRTATLDDVQPVLDLWKVAAEDAHRPADSRQAVRALLVRDSDALILAVERDAIVGTIIAGWDGWRCHVYRLAVAPDRRRMGIGRMLVRAAEERFVALGGTRADAMVLDENDLAHHTWRAAGYAPQNEWSRWVKPLAAVRG